MGLYPSEFVDPAQVVGIAWFANTSTVAESRRRGGGADVVVVQGMEAGGHRGAYDSNKADARWSDGFPNSGQSVDVVRIPVVAPEALQTAEVSPRRLHWRERIQVGTGFLRAPEAEIHPAWADAIARAAPETPSLAGSSAGAPAVV